MDIPRLNGVIRQLEQGGSAFVAFTPAETGAVQAIGSAPYDAIVFEFEHNPYDIQALRNSLQYLLDRRQIATSGSLAPAVTPMIRVPVNGSEMNQWIAKQVLDSGVYGIVWPHISTAEEARNAVAACRYPRPASSSTYNPPGLRGDSPRAAAKYWGLSTDEYYARADVWPIDPKGEIFVSIMCEDMVGVKNLPKILEQVPGIGGVFIGEGDLSQDLGLPRQYDHPTVTSVVNEILAVCNDHKIACGLPHATTKRVESLIKRGFRMLITSPERSHDALETARNAVGRASGEKAKH